MYECVRTYVCISSEAIIIAILPFTCALASTSVCMCNVYTCKGGCILLLLFRSEESPLPVPVTSVCFTWNGCSAVLMQHSMSFLLDQHAVSQCAYACVRIRACAVCERVRWIMNVVENDANGRGKHYVARESTILRILIPTKLKTHIKYPLVVMTYDATYNLTLFQYTLYLSLFESVLLFFCCLFRFECLL